MSRSPIFAAQAMPPPRNSEWQINTETGDVRLVRNNGKVLDEFNAAGRTAYVKEHSQRLHKMGKAALSFFVGAGVAMPVALAVPALAILAPVTGAIAAARSTAKTKNKSWFAEVQIVAVGCETEYLHIAEIGEAELFAKLINDL